MTAATAPALALSEVREGEIYTPREVASLFKVDRHTVAGWCRKGVLRAGKTPGGDYRILGGEVLRAWGQMFQAAATPDPPARGERQHEADAVMDRIRKAKKGRSPKGSTSQSR